MKRRLVPAQVNTKLIVVLVILAVVAGVVWAVKLSGSPQEESLEGLPGGPFTLWCPDCDKEFTYATRADTRELLRKEVNGERLVQCPECKKFVAKWGGRPKKESGKGVQVIQP